MKALFLIGTRPEAIKLWPLIVEARQSDQLETIVASTGQHGQPLDEIAISLGLNFDLSSSILRDGQTISDLLCHAIKVVTSFVDDCKPNLIFVHGDTTTALAGALVGFFQGIPVAHVEAGLRTQNLKQPFPEEANRQLIARVASLHFAPTPSASFSLQREGISPQDIAVVGNSIVDAVRLLHESGRLKLWGEGKQVVPPGVFEMEAQDKFGLVTLHRRENAGSIFDDTLEAIAESSNRFPDFHWIFPVHPNPNISVKAREKLGNLSNVKLLSPVDYPTFIALLANCQFVVTDSGGIQEECVTLSKPCLLIRRTTERPEALDSGYVTLIAEPRSKLLEEIQRNIFREASSYVLSMEVNPFGDGFAAKKIIDHSLNRFGES